MAVSKKHTLIREIEGKNVVFDSGRKTTFGSSYQEFEKYRLEMKCLTKEGTRLLVRIIRSFEKSRLREIGISLYFSS